MTVICKSFLNMSLLLKDVTHGLSNMNDTEHLYLKKQKQKNESEMNVKFYYLKLNI